MEEKEDKNLRIRRRGRGVGEDSLRAESNSFYLAVFTARVEPLSVELKIDGARVPGSDNDLFSTSDDALAAGGQQSGRHRFAVVRDIYPRILAELDDDRELAGSGGRGLRGRLKV